MFSPRSGRLWVSHMLLQKPLPFHLYGYSWVSLYCSYVFLTLLTVFISTVDLV